MDGTGTPVAPGGLFRELSRSDGLTVSWLVLSFVVALFAIFSREPSLFTHTQFYAEDATAWYAEAYNLGWLHSLLLPHAGYLSTVERLATGLALTLPLRWAPLPMMVVGLLVQALPVPILLSSRCRNWAPLPMRLAFAAAYVAIPNATEVHVVLTNSQWHLALALALLAFATTPTTWFGRLFDIGVLLLGALSGPFALMLIPLVCIFWWFRRQRWSLLVLGLLSAGTLVQLFIVLRHPQQRFLQPLGATPALFVRLVGGDIFLGTLLGSHWDGRNVRFAWCVVAFLLGLALIAYCFRHVWIEVRLFFVFCATVLAGGLHTPAFAPTSQPLWPLLLQFAVRRYWFLPSLILLFAVLWCAMCARARVVRFLGVGFAMLLCLGTLREWIIPPMGDVGFRQNAAKFEAAPPGTHVIIPIFPGGSWSMDLVKRPEPAVRRFDR
jgi:hypothetical protein